MRTTIWTERMRIPTCCLMYVPIYVYLSRTCVWVHGFHYHLYRERVKYGKVVRRTIRLLSPNMMYEPHIRSHCVGVVWVCVCELFTHCSYWIFHITTRVTPPHCHPTRYGLCFTVHSNRFVNVFFSRCASLIFSLFFLIFHSPVFISFLEFSMLLAHSESMRFVFVLLCTIFVKFIARTWYKHGILYQVVCAWEREYTDARVNGLIVYSVPLIGRRRRCRQWSHSVTIVVRTFVVVVAVSFPVFLYRSYNLICGNEVFIIIHSTKFHSAILLMSFHFFATLSLISPLLYPPTSSALRTITITIYSTTDATRNGTSKGRRNGIFFANAFRWHEESIDAYTKVRWNWHWWHATRSGRLMDLIVSLVFFPLFFYSHSFFRYFYGPIDGTPFTLAIALPEKYGMHELSSQQEIRHSHQNGKRLSYICETCERF